MEKAVRFGRAFFTSTGGLTSCSPIHTPIFRQHVTSSRFLSSKVSPKTSEENTNDGQKAPNESGFERVTIFHQPTKHVFDIKLRPGTNQISFHLKKTKRLVNLTFEDQFRPLVEKEPSDSVPPMTSISDQMWREVRPLQLSQLPQVYMQLAKFRLTGLVVVTNMAGFIMAPVPFDPVTFLLCTVGTALTSASANAVNQFFEVPYDSQMNRTKNRSLVRGIVSPLHALGFASGAGLTGVLMLYFGVNPLTAGLGAFNLAFYTLAYTPMKRLSVYNTWVGSVVGAIPPMMGWTACTAALDPGAWLLGAVLFAWQFPHFNALSWNLRQDYSRAGYRMLCVTDPVHCRLVALRYSVLMLLLCPAAPLLDITTWTFAADSLPINAYMTFLAWKFYRQGDSNSSRKLFRFTLIHIPAILILMLISKTHNQPESSQA